MSAIILKFPVQQKPAVPELSTEERLKALALEIDREYKEYLETKGELEIYTSPASVRMIKKAIKAEELRLAREEINLMKLKETPIYQEILDANEAARLKRLV